MEQAQLDRAALLDALSRGDLTDQLVLMGVSAEAAAERVARMTDAELAALNDRLSELPAGAGALETILAIFLILIITDSIGVTDIFPFIR